MVEQITQLKLSTIVKNPYQPRLVFDEDKLKELANSIQENGVLQPIIVRKSKLVGYELLAGERRFQASKLAGLETIPAIIRSYSDEEMMTLSILENLQRENLNPLEESKSLAQLADKLGMTHDQIAKALGKSRSYVSNLIRLLGLPDTILKHVENRDISPAHARTLLAEKNPKKQLELVDKIIKEQLNVRALEAIIYGEEKFTDKSISKLNINLFTDETEKELMKKLGNRVKIQANKKYQGNLSIHFDNLDELEHLIKLLNFFFILLKLEAHRELKQHQ